MTSDPRAGRPRAHETVEAAAKEELRERLRTHRQARVRPAALEAARTARVLALSRGHDTVAVYASRDGEPDTWGIIDALAGRGTRVLLPVLRRQPDWGWYHGRAALRPGWQAILEPAGPRLGAAALAEASQVWVSGLAGTPHGDRLGTGGGWYDRALAWAAPAATIGMLLDDDEVVSWLPTDPWDRPVHLIATPGRLLRCHRE